MRRTDDEKLEFLEHLVDGPLNDQIKNIEEESLDLVIELIEGVLRKERAGFDRFFESISQTLKYIPNFIVLAITNKYIDPPIAARITAKLPMKNAVAIAKGLSTDYIIETAIYLDDRYAAELLAKLSRKQASAILEGLFGQHSMRALDILSCADHGLLKLVKPPETLVNQDLSAFSEHRRQCALRLKALYY